MKSGIYQIRHIYTGRLYVGSAVSIRKRWREHKWRLRQNTHHAIHLQNAWNKYGEKAFTFEVLEYCEEDQSIIREQYHLDILQPAFNTCKQAGNILGVKRSEETKKKLSESQRSRPIDLEQDRRRKIAEWSTGKKRSEEAKTAMSKAAKRRIRTPIKFTDEVVKRAIDLRKQGYNYNQLSELTGISRSHLCRIWRKYVAY